MPSIGGLKFDDVLDDLDAGKASALSDLKDILKAHDGNPQLSGIKDKSILLVSQKLFRVASRERLAWAKATKRTTKELAARKATTVAETLRYLVEYFLPHLRSRSVHAVFEHVKDTLSTAEGDWCQPFMQDYFKILDRMFAYQAHVEHLSPEVWQKVVTFLLDAYDRFTEDVEAEHQTLDATTSLSRSMTQRPPRRASETSDHRQTVISCLTHVMTPSSCPIATVAGRLTGLMCAILKDKNMKSTHVAAMQLLNICIKRMSCDLDFMHEVAQNVLPIFPSLLGSLPRIEDLTEQALASLLFLRPHMDALLHSSSGRDMLVHVDSLFEVLWEEYLGKPPRSQLDLHDVFLDPTTWMAEDLMPMQYPSFALRQTTKQTESNWTLLSISAFLLDWIQLQAASRRSEKGTDSKQPSPKRRKRSSKVDDILTKLGSGASRSERKCTLQLLCFFISITELQTDIVEKLVDMCHQLMSSDDPDVADWATIALTCSTTQSQTSSLVMRHRWLEIWRLCTRSITAPSTCRSSCHLAQSLLSLGRVVFDDVKDFLDHLLSAVGSNGPAVVCESSLMFWTTITTTRAFHLPGQATVLGYEQLTTWLCNKWNPSSFESKTHAHQLLAEAPPHLISHTLCRILGQDRHTRLGAPFTELQLLGKTWLWCKENAKLTNWLLEAKDAFPMLLTPTQASTQAVTNTDTTIRRSVRPDLAESILVFLTTQLEQANQRWSNAVIDKAAFINVDMIHVALGICLVSAQLADVIRTTHGRRADMLQKMQLEFLQQILIFAMRPETIDGSDAVLRAIAPFLPRLHSTDTPIEILADVRPFASILCHLSEAFDGFDTRAETRNTSSSFDTEDDLFGDSPRSQPFAKTLDKRVATPNSDARSFVASIANFLHLCADILKEDAQNQSAYLIKRGFTARLLALQVSDFLAIRPLINRILLSRLGMDSMAVQDLLNIVGVKILGDYSWDACDSSITFLIEAMMGTMSLWTDESLPDLFQDGTELYKFLINDLIRDGQCSTAATIIPLADLLYRLHSIDPEYAASIEGQESTRTTLFKLLKLADTASQHHIAERLPEIFVAYTLSNHEKLYGDVVEVLPNDVKHREKIYARLIALTHIGVTWNNMLRQIIYSIFETAGNLSKITQIEAHARACIDFVVQSLHLEDGKQLFQLFSSHLLHSWLEDKPLETIPYKIFGFGNLHDFATNAQDDIVSFSVMRPNGEGLDSVAHVLQKQPKDLIMGSCARTLAHCIAYDVSHPDKNGVAASAEDRAKQTVGEELYTPLLRTHFQDIISLFFLHLDDEDSIEKYLMRQKEQYAHALEALRKMDKYGQPNDNSSQSQQPSWRPKYFLAQIEKMCRRTGNNSKNMWTVNLVVTIARALFNNMHAAYGPTHACRVIQRVRILVCLAGQKALAGYPLEVLLHGLRPFATDKQSADVALPIFRYLLEQGTPYLAKNPWYTAGVCVTMLLSIRGLLDSTQDSTTQESAHKTMLSRADEFRNWIVTWSDTLRKTLDDKQSGLTYHSLMLAAKDSTGKCSGLKGAAESDLLLLLLDGLKSRSKPRLGDEILGLDESSSRACLSILCRDFLTPKPLREDVLGDPFEAARFASLVWTSLKAPSLSINYTTWATRVLGQAYRQTGSIDKEIGRESGLKSLFSTFDRSSRAGSPLGTKERLMALICQQLRSESSKANGLAEAAINDILHSSSNHEEMSFVTRSMPESVAEQYFADRGVVAQSRRSNLDSNVTSIPEIFARKTELSTWAKEVVEALLHLAGKDPMLDALLPFLDAQISLAERVFPYVVHLTLCLHADDHHSEVRDALSAGFNACLRHASAGDIPRTRLLLDAHLYLRCQRLPNEMTIFDRNSWLDLDYQIAARAAHACGMSKTGLLLIECDHTSTNDISRRASGKPSSIIDDESKNLPAELLGTIFRAIEEPDAFYGVEQVADLDTIADRLEYEGDGVQSLLYRGAQLDTMQRSSSGKKPDASSYLLSSLTKLNLSSLVAHFAIGQAPGKDGTKANNSLTKAAMKLRQWDLPSPVNVSSADEITYRTLQSISNLNQNISLRNIVATGLIDTFGLMQQSAWSLSSIVEGFRSFASLSAIDSMTYLPDVSLFEEARTDLLHSRPWMESTSHEAIAPLLVAQEAFAGILLRNSHLRSYLKVSSAQAILTEAHINLYSSRLYRSLDMMQDSLSAITYLSQLSKKTQGSGITFDAAVRRETADVLWARGETLGSIKTLQGLSNDQSIDSQSVKIGTALCLADLAHHLSYARLEKPEDILSKYLTRAESMSMEPARRSEAGKVHHEYATHCHRQLDNQDLKDDLNRWENNARQSDIAMKDLRPFAVSTSSSKDRREAEKELRAHKSWNQIATAEVARLKKDRQNSLLSGLEHYLQSLAASDEYDSDVVGFLALWFGHIDDSCAHGPVGMHAPQVPSKKFIALMNQLSSRLQDSGDEFHKVLGDIVLRICRDHPYHGMYHIYAGSNTSGGHDSQAQSRQGAAEGIAKKLNSDNSTRPIWQRVARSNELYQRMAKLRDPKQFKAGAKLKIDEFEVMKKVAKEVPRLGVPPITLSVAVRDDMKYDNVAKIVKFDPVFRVAGGLSAPKIVVCHATDGRTYRQLFKGGSDDLRQDAIMEQVFEQVTGLLKLNKATRQRGLRIRTYKVVPLDANGGAIEFVEPTTSFSDYLINAHTKYHPKDMKWEACRHKLGDVQDMSHDHKTMTFKQVCSKINPVLRHFFFENFEDPDDWFDARLAYTRSTAAISILGHVLGLGDRHCQNILLDITTGEVVHIDLGVAFEAGRILPKPETVPFRLTRDVVDGFGILKTEGVFRRCCEFTLEALRENKDTIMTLLNVLRYDPLYSWSMSPLRAKKVQKEQDSRADDESSNGVTARSTRRSTGGVGLQTADGNAGSKETRQEDQGGEADRALSTVERKLATGLSVSATVNELIQQATDEKNLAQLFQGWSAFA